VIREPAQVILSAAGLRGFWPYTRATLVFIIPQTVFYGYLGSVARSLLLGDIASPLGVFVMLAGVDALRQAPFWCGARRARRCGRSFGSMILSV
jgi:uncharacterized membrane protein YdjX (TVP38/TMEM64 family)